MRAVQPSDSTCAMSDQPVNPYLRDAVLTATPEQLQLMLYDGAIRFATQAREAIERRDFATSFERLSRAQRIIVEMIKGLNYDVNAELCARVASVYNFIYHKLIDANMNRDVQAINDALRILSIERETWQILVDKVSTARQTAAQDNSDPVLGNLCVQT